MAFGKSSQGPTLMRDQWSVKVERDENYVSIYYNSTFLDLALFFTSTYSLKYKILNFLISNKRPWIPSKGHI